MMAEQEIIGLQETKVRMERLITYYRELGDKERAFVQLLENQLIRVSDALQQHAGPGIC